MLRKKSFFILLGLIASILLIFLSCEENPITFNDNGDVYNGRLYGTVHGIVTLSGSNTPMNGVIVTYSSSGQVKTVTTNSAGFYSISNLVEGDYSITFSPPSPVNAAEALYNVTVSMVNADTVIHGPSSKDYYVSISQDVMLYELSSSVTGEIFGQITGEQLIRGAGVEVKITNLQNYNILDYDFRATADSMGRYTLLNIPAVNNVNVMVLPWSEDGYNFGSQYRTVQLVPGGTVNASPIISQIAGLEVVIISNNFFENNFPVADNLVMTFNKAIDTTSVEVNLAQRSPPFANVPISYSWDTDGLILTIDPAYTLSANFDYDLSISGYAADMTPFAIQETFNTEEGIDLLNTNLYISENQTVQDFDPAGTIWAEFSMPADINNSLNEFRLEDENGYMVYIHTSWTDNNTVLNIDPDQNLKINTDYYLSFKVYSDIPGDFFSNLSNQIGFHTSDASTAPSTPTGFICLNDTIIDYDTQSGIQLKWNLADGVDNYALYASDSYNNTDWINLNNYQSSGGFGTMEVSVNLPNFFDWLSGDNIQTPFANDIGVSFFLIAESGPYSSQPSATITLNDVTPPTFNLYQDASCDNSFNPNPGTVNVWLTQSWNNIEYCDSSIPNYWFVEISNPAFTLNTSDCTWEWNDDYRNGHIIITIPPFMDASGDNCYVNNVIDISGNAQTIATVISLY